MWEIIAAVIGAAISGIVAISREGQAREENYKYNEMSAENADKRTRALYNDISSPTAQRAQIEKAGLSPSLFYSGGVAGTSGMTGAQGGGGGNIAPNVYGINAEQIANIKNINADTKLKEAEANNLASSTKNTELLNEYQQVQNTIQKVDSTISLMMSWNTEDNKETSIYEVAAKSKDFDEYLDKVRDMAKRSETEDSKIFLQATQTERGVQQLRRIYIQAQSFDTEIEIISSDKVSATFTKQVMQALNNSNFAELNKTAAIQYLKTNISAAELTEEQKNAWNNLLRRLEQKTSADTKDIIVVLGMMLNNAMSNYHMPAITTVNKR